MTLQNDHYTYRVTWSPEDEEYIGLCVEFPSLSWLAKSPESALKGIRKTVEAVIQDMKDNTTQAIPLFYKQVELKKGLPFDAGIPNKTTLKTFSNTDAGRDLVICEDTDDILKKLEI